VTKGLPGERRPEPIGGANRLIQDTGLPTRRREIGGKETDLLPWPKPRWGSRACSDPTSGRRNVTFSRKSSKTLS